MKSSLRFVSRVLVVGLTISLIPARVWAMEELSVQKNSPETHVLQSLQRIALRYKNIDAEIIRLLNQYQSDEQIINVLRPLANRKGASKYFDLSRIDQIQAMRDEVLDAEVYKLLQPLNEVLGTWGIGRIAKSLLVSTLQNGLPNAEEMREQERKKEEAERLARNARLAREREEALRQEEEEKQEEGARRKAEAQAREDACIARQKENEDETARLLAQLAAIRAGKVSLPQANSVEQAKPASSSTTPNSVMIEVPVEREEPEVSDHVQSQGESVQSQEQKEELVQPQSHSYDDEDSEDDSFEAAIAEWGREQAALQEAQANHNQEYSPRELSPVVVRTPVAQSSVSEEEISEQSRSAQVPVSPAVHSPVQNVVNEEEIARIERELEQIRLRQEEENRRMELEREVERQAEQEAERQRQELERQRQEAERQVRNAEQEAQQVREQAAAAAQHAGNANAQPNLFGAGLFGVLNNLWGWIKENPVKSTAIGLGVAFGLYKLISNLFGADDEEDNENVDEDTHEDEDADADTTPTQKKRRPAAGRSKQSTKTLSPKDAEKARLQGLKRKRAQLRRAFLKNRANRCNVRCCGRR